MALTNKLDVKIRSTETDEVGLATINSNISISQSTDLEDVPVDVNYTETWTMAGGSVDIDLAGSLTDPLGNVVVFVKVMAIYIINNGDNAMTVGGTNNIPMLGSGDIMNLAAGAYNMMTDPTGITVTPATGDLITVSGTDGDTFDVVLIGSST